MATHGGLWELEDGPDLVDSELVALEYEQHAASRRVGEGRHPVENGRRMGDVLHPYIRI